LLFIVKVGKFNVKESIMSVKLNEVKKHLRAGQVYRRADLLLWSNAVDRHLKLLQKEGVLTKLSQGLYLCPKKTVFGDAPADEDKLVESFLKDHRFLLTSPNAYNTLGLGTTQLYNETVVYNHKRHGRFKLGGRVFEFCVKPHFPKSLSKEFLLVDLVNNHERLAENTEKLLKRVQDKTGTMNIQKVSRMVRDYGNLRTRKFFDSILRELSHVA
jgi:hypothetical protein